MAIRPPSQSDTPPPSVYYSPAERERSITTAQALQAIGPMSDQYRQAIWENMETPRIIDLIEKQKGNKLAEQVRQTIKEVGLMQALQIHDISIVTA